MVDIYLATITHLCIWAFNSFSRSKCLELEELPQERPRFGLKLSRKLSISSSLLCWGERHGSSLVHAPRQRSHEPWLACVFPSVRGIMHTFPWLACVFPSVRGIMHTSPWLACVFPSVRGIMHICLPILWAHTPRQRYELGHFPCGSRNCYGALCSGLLSQSEFWLAALKCSANASNIMDLSMVLRFGSSRSCGASLWGVLDLIWNTQVLPFVGLSAHSPRQSILSCGMKHAELFDLGNIFPILVHTHILNTHMLDNLYTVYICMAVTLYG